MMRTHRSLEAIVTCSDVTTCLSEGSTECTLASETCPPCVYALTGGDFSCYSRDTSGACPFSGAYAECDKSTSTSTTTTTTTSSKSSSSSDSTPKPTTKPPTVTTETPTEAPTTAPKTSAPDTSDSTNSQATTDDSTSTTRATSPPSTTTTSSGSDATQSSKTTLSSSSHDSGAEQTLTSNTSATSGSPAVVNLALIGGAVMLVVIVIAFVARRVMKKKKMASTQEQTVSSNNSAWSDRTLATGTSGGNLYSTYSYKDDAGKGNGISIMSDSQASSTYGPGYNGQSGSSPRSTADFSNFGGKSQFAENSQYYSDYSVSTGPEFGAVAAGQHQYANNGVPPSTRAGNNFVDVTASSMDNRSSELDSMRSGQQPLTVSQLMPTAIEEDEEEAYATRRKPGALLYGAALPTPYNAAVPSSSRQPQIFGASGVSTASSMRSDYDIVDPITMRDVEARNTEMLAEDSRYPKFSFESEADIYDGSSSGEESSDDERVRHGEHTI